MKKHDPASLLDSKLSTAHEIDFRTQLDQYIENSIGSNIEKFQNFSKYIPVQDLRRFLCKYELYKLMLPCHGSIIECGVAFGNGLMTWSQLTEMFEPINRTRQIYGFDTFTGFPELSEKDRQGLSDKAVKGGYAIDSYVDLQKCLAVHDQNRILKHIPRTHLVQGNAVETIPLFLEQNPHLVVSLLYLDFDIYEPTVSAIRHFLPRIPKGGIVAFDELNDEYWPGETQAVFEEIGLNNLRIQRFPYAGTMSYAIIE